MFKKRCIIINQDDKFATVASSLIEFSEKFTFIAKYTCCIEATRNLQNDRPDIILMDIDFPQMKGAKAIDKIKAIHPLAEVLVTTDYTDTQIVFEAFAAGASGYVIKRDSLLNLHTFLMDLSGGGSPVSPIISRKLVDNIQVNKFSPLTVRETEVLRKVAHGKTYSSIADELGISNETSKTHIKNIYRKLSVTSKSEAVTKAISEKLIYINSL